MINMWKLCVCFPKLKSNHHIKVELKLNGMDLTTSETKTIYQVIKDYILERHGIMRK